MSGSAGSSSTRRSGRLGRSRERKDVEVLGAGGGAEGVEAGSESALKVHRASWLGGYASLRLPSERTWTGTRIAPSGLSVPHDEPAMESQSPTAPSSTMTP
jgi:hypothetical protein